MGSGAYGGRAKGRREVMRRLREVWRALWDVSLSDRKKEEEEVAWRLPGRCVDLSGEDGWGWRLMPSWEV